jgi:hypothetical protein
MAQDTTPGIRHEPDPANPNPTLAPGPRSRRAGIGPFRDTYEIERANYYAGQHFFEPDTMRFFSSRVLDGVYGGRYFVTSERRGFDDYRRAYTVRVARDNGQVETVGDFLDFASSAAAHRRAAKLAQARPEVRYDPYPDTRQPVPFDHYAWRVFVDGLPIGPRTTLRDAHKMRRELARDNRK